MNWLSIIVSSLISGLAGVVISIIYYRNYESRQHKLQLLEKLIGNRYDLTGQTFTEALNQVFIVFYDSWEVKAALKDFYEVIIDPRSTQDRTNQKLLDLFKAMCENLKISIDPLNDNFFLTAFNVNQTSDTTKKQ
jgi:hypothetical protein